MTSIYWFARIADDLADEGTASPDERLADLAAFHADLSQVFTAGGGASRRWPGVFAPLRTAVERHELPMHLLADLLSAFEQDVTKQAYANRTELLDYCRRSANPVGRLLLHLYNINDGQALQQSDAVCTALQLINFWQDLGVDTRRGRLYLPAADCARHGVDPTALMRGQGGTGVTALLAEEVGWARAMMLDGAPLVHRIGGRAGWELRLVVQGGLRILDLIEAGGFATQHARPALRWHDAPRLLWRAMRMQRNHTATLGKPHDA